MSVRSLLLGLDVSPRRIGWALCDLVTGEPMGCGCEVLWPDVKIPVDWSEQRKRVHEALKTPHWFNAGEVAEVGAIYIEQPGLPPKSGTKSAYDAGRAVQAVQGECERRWPWVTVQFLQPSEWKGLAEVRAKGSVTRDDVAMVAAGVCPLPKARDMKPEVYLRAIDLGFRPDGSQDAADAGCIAVAGFHRNEDTWERGEVRDTATEEAA